MKIRFRREGGFAYIPALARELIIDTTAMTAHDAAKLQKLVQAANFFALPRRVGKLPTGAADMQYYTITVEDRSKRKTVQVFSPESNEKVSALVTYIEDTFLQHG